ncbi:hypothetical protein [Streptomyces sp. NPDC094468]
MVTDAVLRRSESASARAGGSHQGGVHAKLTRRRASDTRRVTVLM